MLTPLCFAPKGCKKSLRDRCYFAEVMFATIAFAISKDDLMPRVLTKNEVTVNDAHEYNHIEGEPYHFSTKVWYQPTVIEHLYGF